MRVGCANCRPIPDPPKRFSISNKSDPEKSKIHFKWQAHLILSKVIRSIKISQLIGLDSKVSRKICGAFSETISFLVVQFQPASVGTISEADFFGFRVPCRTLIYTRHHFLRCSTIRKICKCRINEHMNLLKICSKIPHHSEICLRAQEKLHPTCAKNPDLIDLSPSNGVVYSSVQPACHTVAEICREDSSCRYKTRQISCSIFRLPFCVDIFECYARLCLYRSRLEQYEQACAIDSSTLKCAGHTSSCRTAILGILGTPLRSSCSCHNTDSVYECLGWYRLLWLNTCVGKFKLSLICFQFNRFTFD